MATHSSILAWETPWTEEPGGLQSMDSQRVRHDSTHTHTHTHTSSHSQKPGIRLDFALSLSSIFNQFVAYLAKFTFHIYFKINSLLSSLLELCLHSKPHYLPTKLLL